MQRSQKTKCGYALVTTLLIMTTLATTFAMMIQIGRQRLHTAKRLSNRAKALAYAEAGIDFAYSIVSVDMANCATPSLFTLNPGGTTLTNNIPSTYGEGSFELTLNCISNRYVVITSVGKCGDAEQVAEILVEDVYAGSGGTNGTNYADMEGFNFAILSGATFGFKGSGSVLGSPGIKVHSNNQININGNAQTYVDISSSTGIRVGNNTINGSITATSVKTHHHATITGGTTETTVPPVEIPDIDLTPYYTWASQHGEVYVGDFSTAVDYTPNGGILYVIGDVEVSSHAVFNGSIIATGNITITGQADIRPTTDVIAMATEHGNLENTSTGTMEGLIYSKTGNYKQTANGTLEGQIIVGGEVAKGGESDIIIFKKSIPTPPGTTGVTPTKSLPVVAGWQK